MLAVVRKQASLHYWRQSRITALVARSRQYSREWNEWKRSEERTLFLQRNERMLVRLHVSFHVTYNINRAFISTGVTVVIGLAAIKGAKS